MALSTTSFALPANFIYLEDIDPSIKQDVRYFTANNFIGRPVKGYLAPRCILTYSAGLALKRVQDELKPQGLGLKVFDCYRPQMACNDFMIWSKDIADQKTKKDYFPRVNKADFFKVGYVAEKSSHSRGSTVDLTIIRLANQTELNMGTHFDFMDELSHPSNTLVGKEAYDNRMLLSNLMQKYGFEPILTEWWHFTLKDEPYPEQYFNFVVQ